MHVRSRANRNEIYRTYIYMKIVQVRRVQQASQTVLSCSNTPRSTRARDVHRPPAIRERRRPSNENIQTSPAFQTLVGGPQFPPAVYPWAPGSTFPHVSLFLVFRPQQSHHHLPAVVQHGRHDCVPSMSAHHVT
jgi:hypothetical protein